MKRPQTKTIRALRRFREECKEEGLSLECALATLAMSAERLRNARDSDSYQRVMSALGSICQEMRNVTRALAIEYPDIR